MHFFGQIYRSTNDSLQLKQWQKDLKTCNSWNQAQTTHVFPSCGCNCRRVSECRQYCFLIWLTLGRNARVIWWEAVETKSHLKFMWRSSVCQNLCTSGSLDRAYWCQTGKLFVSYPTCRPQSAISWKWTMGREQNERAMYGSLMLFKQHLGDCWHIERLYGLCRKPESQAAVYNTVTTACADLWRKVRKDMMW